MRRAVLLIGRDAPLIAKVVPGRDDASSLEEAVERAAQLAKPGEAVLLSPACASFDMFRDYRHRGDVFAAAVEGPWRREPDLRLRAQRAERASTIARSPGRRCCSRPSAW